MCHSQHLLAIAVHSCAPFDNTTSWLENRRKKTRAPTYLCDRNLESFNAPCKLHGSPKTTATNTMSPLHRLQNLDLMDDIPLTYSKEAQTNSPVLTTPIIEHNKMMTPRRQANHHHQLHAQNSDLSSTSAMANQKNKSFNSGESSSGINVVSGSMYNCDGTLIGNSSFSAIASSSGAGASSSSANQSNQHHHYSHQQQQQHQQQPSQSSRQSHHSHHQHNLYSSNNKLDDGCGLRHRWHACPELHKAMDGVNYIADHTKKEEESTKVSKYVSMNFFFSFATLFFFRPCLL